MSELLPSQFRDLERFVDKWDQPGTNARYNVRLASTMAELQDFHDAMMARGSEIKDYLNARRFSDYGETELRLVRLMFALAIVAQAVEVYKSVAVPDTGAAGFTFLAETELTPSSPMMAA